MLNETAVVVFVEIVGLIAFAFSGALAGVKKDLDVIGCVVLGTATGIGGGTLRDVILDVPVFWLGDYMCYSLNVCVLSSVVIYLMSRVFAEKEHIINWFDAIGLAIFSVQGYLKAFEATSNFEVAIIMGILTGCGGGLIRDVCLNRQPFIFRGEMYASASLLGLLVLIFVDSPLVAFALILGIRVATIRYNLKLK
ncbi:MAG: trimeric intracellular cation channel family protein [Verrucomicrobiaceae bacterium]|nr:trimeric intracellular cation channel family protein [Verrucomicrobiaceae bacterium]